MGMDREELAKKIFDMWADETNMDESAEKERASLAVADFILSGFVAKEEVERIQSAFREAKGIRSVCSSHKEFKYGCSTCEISIICIPAQDMEALEQKITRLTAELEEAKQEIAGYRSRGVGENERYEIKRLTTAVARLREALVMVKNFLESDNLDCFKCGYDPDMTKEDIYKDVVAAIASGEVGV